MPIDKLEEKHLQDVIIAAREIQDFLWGRTNDRFGIEEWRRMFRKRVAKIDAVDLSNPYAIIELKKRFLQAGALSVAVLAILDREGVLPEHKEDEPVSNLPQYKGDK